MGAQNATGTALQFVPATFTITALLTVWFFIQHFLFANSALNPRDLAVHPEAPYQLLTYFTALISHWSVEHLTGNLFGLTVVGTYVEHKTDTHTVIAIFCITALIVFSSYVTACAAILPCGYFMGASVGIYGLYGAGAALIFSHVTKHWSSIFRTSPALAGLLLIFRQLLTLISGNYIPATFHVIGALCGIGIYVLFRTAASNITPYNRLRSG